MTRGLIGMVAAAALVVCWPGAASAAAGWARQPTPLPPGAMFGETAAVSCAAIKACTADGPAPRAARGAQPGHRGEIPAGLSRAARAAAGRAAR